MRFRIKETIGVHSFERELEVEQTIGIQEALQLLRNEIETAPVHSILVPEPKPEFFARSGHWSTIRDHHLEQFPTCAVCGGKKNLQVHHIKPYHLHPELELEPENLLTLCEPSSIIHINCHLLFGHCSNWHAFNSEVIQMAAQFLKQFQNRTFN